MHHKQTGKCEDQQFAHLQLDQFNSLHKALGVSKDIRDPHSQCFSRTRALPHWLAFGYLPLAIDSDRCDNGTIAAVMTTCRQHSQMKYFLNTGLNIFSHFFLRCQVSSPCLIPFLLLEKCKIWSAIWYSRPSIFFRYFFLFKNFEFGASLMCRFSN